MCLLATIFELIKDYKEKDEATLEISNEFKMATENEKTPLLHGNDKSDIPEIKHQSKGMFCYKRTVFLGSVHIQIIEKNWRSDELGIKLSNVFV